MVYKEKSGQNPKNNDKISPIEIKLRLVKTFYTCTLVFRLIGNFKNIPNGIPSNRNFFSGK